MHGFTVDAMFVQSWQNGGHGAAKVALRFQDHALTYADLADRVSAFAGGLEREGVRHGDRIGILLHNCTEFMETFFAIARLGAVAVPLNYLLTKPEIVDQVEDSSVRLVVTSPALVDKAPSDVTIVGVGEAHPSFTHTYEQLLEAGRTDPVVEPRAAAGDLVLLQYTSGTTGRPKAVAHTHETVLWNSYHQIPDLTMTKDDVYLCIPALCWAAGMHDFTLATLWLGGTVVLFPSRGLRHDEVLRTIERHGVTLGLFVPPVLKGIAEEPSLSELDISSLTRIVVGSTPIPVSVLESAEQAFPNAGVLQAYGMSEFPTIMSVLDAEHAHVKVGSAGRPTSITMMRIFDDAGHPVAPGTVGEIVVKSPATMTGYQDRPDANAEAFRTGWFYTGDLGYLDSDGYLFVVGRSKDMIIRGGLNVYPAEVEMAIVEYPGINEIAVVGVPDEAFGEAGVAVYVAQGEVPADALLAHCRERLASFKIPVHWVQRSEPLPRTASGKLHKPSIREWVVDRGVELS